MMSVFALPTVNKRKEEQPPHLTRKEGRETFQKRLKSGNYQSIKSWKMWNYRVDVFLNLETRIKWQLHQDIPRYPKKH